jgi:hypothetical protein
LIARRDAALKGLAGIEDRRAALSYDAHVQGGVAAKKLEKLNAERAEKKGLIEELEHAIREAAERVAEAAGGERRAREEQRKDAALPVLKRFAQRGAAIDAAWSTIREQRKGLKDDLNELRRLGAPAPRDELVEVNLRTAFDTAAAGAGVQGAAPVAPLARRSVAEVVTGWSRPVAAWIATRLFPTSNSGAA